jgi:hypothetical protein
VYSSDGVMSKLFSLTGPAQSRYEYMFIRCDRVAQVSSVETTVYLSRNERVSRRETRITSVGADNGNRNIAILLRNMFAVKRVRFRRFSQDNESMDITSRGT